MSLDGMPPPVETDCRPAGRRSRPRIAVYSHDTQGLGHIRRNLLISHALGREDACPIILLLSGLREASAFAMPAGVDCLTLPSLAKNISGQYVPRTLGLSMDDLMTVRTRALTAALQSFEPDVLIVDKTPLGVHDELLPGIRGLNARGRTRLVLGLREVLDDPDVVRREWARGSYDQAIARFFDQIWVYGDRRVFDPVTEYQFERHLADLVRFSGYLNPRDVEDETTSGTERKRSDRQRALCLVGGGADGLGLATAFLDAHFDGDAMVVTGPRMPSEGRAALQAVADGKPNARVLEFVTDPCPLIAAADRVVAMGGYNTVCEILAYGKPALIVPRTEPRTEQLIRATRFAELGLVDMLHPDLLSADAVSSWLARDASHIVEPRDVIDFDGVAKLPEMLEEVIAAGETRGGPTYAAG